MSLNITLSLLLQVKGDPNDGNVTHVALNGSIENDNITKPGERYERSLESSEGTNVMGKYKIRSVS